MNTWAYEHTYSCISVHELGHSGDESFSITLKLIP
jgi:hypothetical protein